MNTILAQRAVGPRYQMRTFLVALLVPLVCTPIAFARKWTDATGKHTVEAELVESSEGTVRLKKGNGQIISLPLEQLSDADQEYVRSRVNRAGFALAGLRTVTAEQVRNAIDRGIGYLLARQRDDGSWPGSKGVNALCTLALLNAGVELDHEGAKMQKALYHLRYAIQPERTYAVSLQTMVFAQAEPDRDHELILRNVRWLEQTQIAEGPKKGAWCYPYVVGSGSDVHEVNGVPVIGDNSNSQFALLALHEAERVGVVANEQTWRLAREYWEQGQNQDGSWGYPDRGGGTGSMTCAGITSLVITADKVQQSDARASGDGVERAIQWLGNHYSVTSNPGCGGRWTLYYLYGLERAGRLTARRFIPLPSRPGRPSRADWYRDGAEHLIRTQDSQSGSWSGSWTSSPDDTNPLIGTSFALLFLSKGRWPVLAGKLQWGGGDDWNRHRSDVGNLTRYVETRWRRDLTWQVIDLRLAEVDDLIQTPVLYLCGSRSPLPESPAQRRALGDKLRDYLDRGGFLLGVADYGGEDFDKGFRDLMREVFPEPECGLRPLEPEHPIWDAEEEIDPQQLRPLLGIELRDRTRVVYAPPDEPQDLRPSLLRLWELSRPGRNVEHSPAVQAQVDAAMSLGINVMAYATEGQLKTKESFFRHTPP